MGKKLKGVSENYLLGSTYFKWRITHFVFLSLLPPQLLSGKETLLFLLSYQSLYNKTTETTILHLYLQGFCKKVERHHFHPILICAEESLFS